MGDIPRGQFACAQAEKSLPFGRPVGFVGGREVQGCHGTVNVRQALTMCVQHPGKTGLQLRSQAVLITRARHVTTVGAQPALLEINGASENALGPPPLQLVGFFCFWSHVFCDPRQLPTHSHSQDRPWVAGIAMIIVRSQTLFLSPDARSMLTQSAENY